MSIRNDGFVTYSELQSCERRARELRSEAIRAGSPRCLTSASVTARLAAASKRCPAPQAGRSHSFFDHGGLTSIDILP